jgi:hypothetical protein
MSGRADRPDLCRPDKTEQQARADWLMSMNSPVAPDFEAPGPTRTGEGWLPMGGPWIGLS